MNPFFYFLFLLHQFSLSCILKIFSRKKTHSSSDPVDLVYLRVDGSDSVWLKKKNSYSTSGAGGDSNRFRHFDELKYSLRSVELYANRVRKIFIVTDGQVPDRLVENERVIIVDHTSLFDSSELPLFNAQAIETKLAHVPGIAENFIYMNDDMFFSSPVFYADFFGPNFFYKHISLTQLPVKLFGYRVTPIGDYYSAAYNHSFGILNESTSVRMVGPQFFSHHFSKSFFSSTYKTCLDKFILEADDTVAHKFREKVELNPPGLVQEFGILHNNSKVTYTSGVYFLLDSRLYSINKLFFYLVSMISPKNLCINMGKNITQKDIDLAESFLLKLFPKKSQSES